ncbi:transferase family III [Trichoderma arundinaceum]|uniref:Transferase family III n=1 Tax=Trichoderma arundinaceum TaxID=490622 RepID=A0A395P0S0_TRIAR|nr:transferase family III [Trichoderma arundinaceum]
MVLDRESSACVFARRAEWIKNACLAAALLLPAVAAVHGIVLAALHRENAVDMDVYGAFQLCSIGILVAPMTVRLSKTYFNTPGRNTIFLWAGLILAAPTMLTFGTATLLAAACCVHAIVWMASMTEKVFESNWKSRFGISTDDTQADEPISGTNGATKGTMKGVNDMVRFFLSVAAVPVFGGAGLVILIVGEINFFSGPVSYQVEPLASVGQWAPIVGTGLAAIGSLYLVLAADVEAVKEETDPNAVHHCKCSHLHFHHHDSPIAPSSSSDRDRRSHSPEDGYLAETPESAVFPEMRHSNTGLSTISFHGLDHTSTMPTGLSNDPAAAIGRHMSSGSTVQRSSTNDSGNRRKVAKIFVSVGNTLGAKTQDWFDDSEFKRGPALDWPEIPGEFWRNKRLQDIRDQYNPHRDADGNATPLPRSRSRASSYMGGIRDVSPQPGLSLSRSHSPTRPPPSLPRQQRASTLPETHSFGLPAHAPAPLASQSRGRQRVRRDTLEVPPASHHNPLHIHYPEPVTPTITMSGGRSSPPSLKDNDDGGSDREPIP